MIRPAGTTAPVNCPSPNAGPRRDNRSPDILLIHYTGMRTAEEALVRLCTTEAQVSAHYLIDEDGTLYSLVPETLRAWHAGISAWENDRDINSRSIGIELVNPGHEFGYRPFTEAQIRRLIALSRDIIHRYDIKPWHVLGHSDVAPLRKMDPGELFPWQKLAREGVGLWPESTDASPHFACTAHTESLTRDAETDRVVTLQNLLSAFGYDVPLHGRYDDDTALVVTAAQRHWTPQNVNGVADGRLIAILERLVEAKGTNCVATHLKGRTPENR